jgi:hypothetical protein
MAERINHSVIGEGIMDEQEFVRHFPDALDRVIETGNPIGVSRDGELVGFFIPKSLPQLAGTRFSMREVYFTDSEQEAPTQA